MNIVDLCKIIYPGMLEARLIQFGQDIPDGPITIKYWAVPDVVQPTEAQLESLIPQYQRQFDIECFENSINLKINALLNSTAKARGYYDVMSIVGYVNSTNTQWQAEAQAFISWRDQVWERAYIEFLSIHAGGTIPNEDDFMSSLPIIIWP